MTTTKHPPVRPSITIRQIHYIESLARQLGWYQAELNTFTNARYGANYTDLTTQTASTAIDALQALGEATR